MVARLGCGEMSSTRRQRNPISLVRRQGDPGSSDGHTPGEDDVFANTRAIDLDGKRWIDIREPNAANIDYLRDEFDLHPLLLEDIMSRIQRPKIDVYDDYLFIVMQFPIHNKRTRVNVASEIDMVVGRDYFITLHDGQLKPLVNMVDAIFANPDTAKRLMERTPGHLLYEVVDRLVDYCVPIIPQVAERVERLEEKVFERPSLQTVQEISLVRRDIITLRRIIKPQLAVVSQLEHRDLPFVSRDIDAYWGDISDHLGRIWDSIDDFRDVLESLSDTYNTLTSHRLNDVIKALTMISVIVLPMTLVTGIFGMNVPLPLEGSSWALLAITAAIGLLGVLMVIIFRLRRWI